MVDWQIVFDCRIEYSCRVKCLWGIRIELGSIVEQGMETNLVETDVGGLLTEALTADVHLKSIRISHTSPCHITYCRTQ